MKRAAQMESPTAKPAPLAARIARVMGPGLITGASDDDPSGIATYSQAGAQFGFNLDAAIYVSPNGRDSGDQRADWSGYGTWYLGKLAHSLPKLAFADHHCSRFGGEHH